MSVGMKTPHFGQLISYLKYVSKRTLGCSFQGHRIPESRVREAKTLPLSTPRARRRALKGANVEERAK